jgi:LysM repeat protein
LLKKLIIILFCGLPCLAQAQLTGLPDGLPDELNQEQWEAVRDYLVVDIIKLLARKDTLQLQIDSLRNLNASIDSYSCEEELYAIVGATREQVGDFRLRFDEAERQIRSQTGTPDAARSYYAEISSSNIRCLPEFSERFASLKKQMEQFTVTDKTQHVTSSENYTVVKGDCLWRISLEKYGTRYLWPAIWEANRSDIPDSYFIYPGQVLKIPIVTDEERKRILEGSAEYRRSRKREE